MGTTRQGNNKSGGDCLPKFDDLDGIDDGMDYASLDKELSNLDTCLAKMEDWSESLQQKVADLLESTKEQNKAAALKKAENITKNNAEE